MTYELCAITWTPGTNRLTGQTDPRRGHSYKAINWMLPTIDKCRELASFLGVADYYIRDERGNSVVQTDSFTQYLARTANEELELRSREQEKVVILNARPERLVVHEFATGEKIVLKRLPASIASYSYTATCPVQTLIEHPNLRNGAVTLELSNYKMGPRWMRQKFTNTYRSLACVSEIAAHMETYWSKIRTAKAELVRTDAQ